LRRRSWARAPAGWLAAGAVLAALAGCASTARIRPGEHVTVYVSAPLSGPQAARGRAAVAAARRALARERGRLRRPAVRVVYMDDAKPGAAWDQVAVAANARRATEDSTAVAYVGELARPATRISRAITDQAGLLQVAPVGGPAMAQVLRAIHAARPDGDTREAVKDAWNPLPPRAG